MLEKGLPKPQTEKTFMYSRYWRFDFLFEEEKLAIEYQGGLFQRKTNETDTIRKSGHNNIMGQTRDWEKANEAQIRGYMVMFVNPKTIDDGTAIDQIVRAYKVKRGEMRYE